MPKVDLPRAISALLHLFIPFVIYNIMYKDFGRERLSKYAPEVYELSDDRKQLYMILDVYYSIRWAMGVTIMMSRVTLPLGVAVAAKHLLVDEMGYVVGSMAFAGARPGPLTTRDYLAATFMVVAGILQHGTVRSCSGGCSRVIPKIKDDCIQRDCLGMHVSSTIQGTSFVI